MALFWLRFLTILVLIPVQVFGAESESKQLLTLNEDQSLIVQVKYQGHVLSDAIFIYAEPDYVLVPLGELLTALEFPIDVDAERQIASGWFLSEHQTFNADFNQKTLYIQGQAQPLPEPLLVLSDGFDLYVSADYLQQWFGITANFLHSQLVLSITTQNPLPIAVRLAREKKRASLGKDVQEDSVPIIANHYQAVVLPGIDMQLSLQNNQHEVSTDYSIQGSGDLMYHESRYAFSGSANTGLDSARLSLSRQGATPDHTLFLGSNSYELGDILSYSDPLILSSSSGLGVTVTRGVNLQPESFSTHVLEGDGQSGWEVELYRNGILIDFQVIPTSGRYLFDDVELIYGENIFDLILYGPQGQKRTRRETIRVGDQMISPGQMTYRLTHLREHDSLFGIDASGGASEVASALTELQGHYGLDERQTLGLGVFRQYESKEKQSPSIYQRLSVNSAWPWFTSSISYANQNQAGDAYHVIGVGRLSNLNWTLEHRAFDDFFSEQSEEGRLEQEQEISIDSTYLPSSGNQWRYKVDLSRRLLQLNEQFQLDTRVSSRWGGIRWANELGLNYTPSTEVQAASQTTQGQLNLNRTKGLNRMRAVISYGLAPEVEVNSIALTYDYVKNRTLRYQWHSNLGLESGGSRGVGFSISKKYDRITTSINADYDTQERLSILLKLDFGLRLDDKPPFIQSVQPGLVDSGMVLARVFLDHDENKRWSEGDEPLETVSFLGRTQWEKEQTDGQGKVLLSHFDPQQPTRLRLNQLTLGDPYLHSSNPEVLVYSHAGAHTKIEFPVLMTTEVEGTVLLLKGEKTRPGSGIRLIMVNASGETVSQTRTEFDGFYFFTGIPPGSYTITVDPEEFDPAQFQSTTVSIQASVEQGVVYAEDLVVTAVQGEGN